MLKHSLVTTLFILIFFRALPQDTEKNQSLSLILQQLENRYDVKFTYADDVIAGKLVSSSPGENTLQSWLRHLTLQTGLKYHQIDEQFIAIRAVTSLCGKLLNKETLEPVAYATVSLGTSSTTVSDETGWFEIAGPLNLQDSVRINHLAYAPLAVGINGVWLDSCREVLMAPRLAALSEIVISNYLVTGISKTRGGEFVMNPQEQQILPGLTEPDVLFTLQVFPGIESVAESVADINIRGGTNDQNLVLWDGIRMYQTGHLFGLISAFNPYLIDRIILIKNGTSAAYGEGVSGTILMKTKEAHTEKIAGGAGTNLIHSDFHLSLPLSDKISLSMAARRSTTDWFTSPTYKSYFNRAFQHTDLDHAHDSLLAADDHFYFYDLQAKMNWKFSERDQLRVNALRIYNQLEYTESTIINGDIEAGTSELAQKTTAGSIFYRRLWNQNLSTTLHGYLSGYKLEATNQNILNDQELIQENEIIDILFAGKMHLILSQYLDIHGGYTYDQIGVGDRDLLDNPAFSRYVRKVLHAHLFFVEGNFLSPDHSTRLQTGLRASYYPRIDRMLLVEPRISLNHQLTEELSIELLGEMKNQTMTQIIDLQNDFLGVEKRRWALADGGDIPVIQSSQASIGVHYIKNDFLVSAEGYYKVVKGVITSSQAFQNQFELIRSTGSYRTRGMDLLVRKKFNPIAVWVSYSLAGNNYLFEELIPDPFPNNLDIRHHTYLGSSFKKGAWESSIGVNWHSGRPYTQPVADEPVSNGLINYRIPNSSRLGDYLRVDFSSTYEFPIGKKTRAQAGLSLWNLTNRKNVFDAYYQLSQSAEVPTRVDRLALGFTPNIMFRIRF